MNNYQRGIDRLMRGLTTIGVTLAGSYALQPLDSPAQTMQFVALSMVMVMAYGAYLTATAEPTLNGLKRIVPEQYH